MAVVVNGDVYQVRMLTTLYGQECNNVFFYQQIEDDAAGLSQAQFLAQQFRTDFCTSGGYLNAAFFMVDWVLQSVNVINLYDLDDIGSVLDGVTAIGTQTTGGMPPMNAVGFHTPQVTRNIRRGQKRFPAVSEEHQAQGVWDSDQDTYLASLADGLGANIEFQGSPGDSRWQPVVVKRIKETDEQGKVTYRLPENVGETDLFYAGTWSVIPQVTTQNSRKIGRGA